MRRIPPILALIVMTASFTGTPAAGEPDRAAAVAARIRPQLEKSLAARNLALGDPVFIRIFKEERQLELWIREPNGKKFRLFKSWPVAAMSGTLGPKLAEGDRQAPEGFYSVPRSALNPRSSFHLSFNLGYPNSFDRAHARTGSALMVHGSNLSVGCFAMTDPVIEEIYTLCAVALAHGQPAFQVHIFPFRMTQERLAASATSQWAPFWLNLAEGYNAFETTSIPPRISVAAQRYAVEISTER